MPSIIESNEKRKTSLQSTEETHRSEISAIGKLTILQLVKILRFLTGSIVPRLIIVLKRSVNNMVCDIKDKLTNLNLSVEDMLATPELDDLIVEGMVDDKE